jgi:REP element-mobilizing transposase RayT
MKDLKGTSSFWINEEKLIKDYFQWQDGYSAFSVSPFMLEKIRKYIVNQEEHHKNIHYNQEINNLVQEFETKA